jgi:hypothetical protein
VTKMEVVRLPSAFEVLDSLVEGRRFHSALLRALALKVRVLDLR